MKIKDEWFQIRIKHKNDHSTQCMGCIKIAAIITGNKYKFGLYFKSSCTTAENPLCAALKRGVAPSYWKMNKFNESNLKFWIVNSFSEMYLHNGRHQHGLHFSIIHEQCDRDPFDWQSIMDWHHRFDIRLDHRLRLTVLAKQHDVHSVMLWKSVSLYPVILHCKLGYDQKLHVILWC